MYLVISVPLVKIHVLEGAPVDWTPANDNQPVAPAKGEVSREAGREAEGGEA